MNIDDGEIVAPGVESQRIASNVMDQGAGGPFRVPVRPSLTLPWGHPLATASSLSPDVVQGFTVILTNVLSTLSKPTLDTPAKPVTLESLRRGAWHTHDRLKTIEEGLFPREHGERSNLVKEILSLVNAVQEDVEVVKAELTEVKEQVNEVKQGVAEILSLLRDDRGEAGSGPSSQQMKEYYGERPGTAKK